MRAYFINSETDEHGPIDIEPTLSEYHRLIGCDCVDMVTREIDDHPYSFIVDDEGMLKKLRITGVSAEGKWPFGAQEHLYGSILIFGSDPSNIEHGNSSLTDEELHKIRCHVFSGVFEDGSLRPVLSYTR